MKIKFLLTVLTFISSNALALSSATSSANDENSIYPVVIALAMISGGIIARLLTKKNVLKNS